MACFIRGLPQPQFEILLAGAALASAQEAIRVAESHAAQLEAARKEGQDAAAESMLRDP